MRGCTARHDKPRVTACGVIPKLLVQSGGIGSDVDVVYKGLHGAGISSIRPSDRGVAIIEKLVETAFAAAGTRDAHNMSPSRGMLLVKIGAGSHALLIDHPPC